MYHQLELARTGAALFKICGKYLKNIAILSMAVAYFNGGMGPVSPDNANMAWFIVSFDIAAAGAGTLLAYMCSRGLRYFTSTFDGI